MGCAAAGSDTRDGIFTNISALGNAVTFADPALLAPASWTSPFSHILTSGSFDLWGEGSSKWGSWTTQEPLGQETPRPQAPHTAWRPWSCSHHPSSNASQCRRASGDHNGNQCAGRNSVKKPAYIFSWETSEHRKRLTTKQRKKKEGSCLLCLKDQKLPWCKTQPTLQSPFDVSRKERRCWELLQLCGC